MKLQCEDCRCEIKAAPVKENQRCFCNARCREQWKRRMARFSIGRQEPVAFGDA